MPTAATPPLEPSPGPAETYRPEVDGLRAVAVLAVLLFHAGVRGCGGGFVGVDVFFVISGYLITRLVLGELDGERFRFSRFYGRRARRLFPALFVTLAATLAASAVVLSPMHLEELARSLIGALFSCSNMFFWSRANYFDTASAFKPLLHTWSLGVEEQFYLVWPISIVLAYRWRRAAGVRILIATFGIASLAAAEYAAGNAPEAAFFLMPFRMCELALGAACVWLEVSSTGPAWRRELLTLAGLAAIAYSVAAFSPAQRFPGLTAMVPCGGAALVVAAGRGRLSGLLLANRAAVGLGLISYSLYLVHWPLLVLWRYGAVGAPSSRARAAFVGLSIGLAIAMYFFVEQPFRRRRAEGPRLPAGGFGLACAGFALALLVPATLAIARHGWPRRIPEQLRAAASQLPEMQLRQFAAARAQDRAPFPAPGRRNAVIIGDSHGADLLTALMRAGSTVNYRLLNIEWFCQPILGERPFGEGTPIKSREIAAECERKGEALKENRLLRSADIILIASSWRDYGLAGLPATVDYLKSHYRVHIALFGARFGFTDPSALLTAVSTYAAANRRFDETKSSAAIDREWSLLSHAAERGGVDLVDLRPYTCDRASNGWFCPLLLDDGELLYWDFHHWTEAGALRVGQRLKADGRYAWLF